MVLAITEINAWERERWTYAIDMFTQDAETVNNLMIFTRLANAVYEEAQQNRKQASDPFACSKYWLRFYDKVEFKGDSVRLVNRKGTNLTISINRMMGGYKGNTVDLHLKLSAMKVKSAMIAMRDKKENNFYKRFEDAFLKKKYQRKDHI
jgi:hypothetical protein